MLPEAGGWPQRAARGPGQDEGRSLVVVAPDLGMLERPPDSPVDELRVAEHLRHRPDDGGVDARRLKAAHDLLGVEP